MQLSNEYIESLMEQGIDVKNKVLSLDEDITHATFLKVIKAFSLIQGELVLIINSDGGSYYDSMAIVDLIQRRGNVHTMAAGKALSSALLILTAGAKRTATKNSWLLYHNSFYEQEGAHKEIKASVEQSEREEIQGAEFMAANTKKSKKFWKQIADTKEFYFSAKEALKLGVIHEIA